MERSVSILVLVLVACTPPSEPVASPRVHTDAVAHPRTPTRAAVATPPVERPRKFFSCAPVPDAERPARVVPPAAVACELHDSIGGMQLGLRFASDKPPFAWLDHARISLSVPTGTRPRQGFVTAELEDLTLAGAIAVSDVVFHPKFPLVLAGFLMLKADAALDITHAGTDGLRVQYHIEPTEELIVRPLVPVESTLGCSDVTLESPFYNAWSALERTSWNAALLARGTTLRTDAAGPAVARIEVRHSAMVPVFETRAGWVRIAFDTPSAVVVGWVSHQALDPAPPDMLGTISTLGHGAGTGTGQGFAQVRVARCSREVPLVVEQAGERRTVGSVHAGVSIELQSLRDDSVETRIGGAGWHRAEGTTWFVLQGDLDGCELRGPSEKAFNFEHRPLPWPRSAPQR